MFAPYTRNCKKIHSKGKQEKKMISLICSVKKTEDIVTVEAVIEDAVQIAHQTLVDPPEYGPAVCTARVYLEEGEVIPDNEDELIEYLESLELDWEPNTKDWDY